MLHVLLLMIDDVFHVCFVGKKLYPPSFLPKLNSVDEMQCWETDECPVEDDKKFTKAWQLHSAERDPTTETHFDSEVRTTN